MDDSAKAQELRGLPVDIAELSNKVTLREDKHTLRPSFGVAEPGQPAVEPTRIAIGHRSIDQRTNHLIQQVGGGHLGRRLVQVNAVCSTNCSPRLITASRKSSYLLDACRYSPAAEIPTLDAISLMLTAWYPRALNASAEARARSALDGPSAGVSPPTSGPLALLARLSLPRSQTAHRNDHSQPDPRWTPDQFIYPIEMKPLSTV